uniref:Alternative protein ZBTB7A n=1 Tax=Homo sapiens TaxID=9606 RepID=L8E8Q6_HUMAN|nr:alternative protein ZBTB7A [Homo sapiens]
MGLPAGAPRSPSGTPQSPNTPVPPAWPPRSWTLDAPTLLRWVTGAPHLQGLRTTAPLPTPGTPLFTQRH